MLLVSQASNIFLECPFCTMHRPKWQTFRHPEIGRQSLHLQDMGHVIHCSYNTLPAYASVSYRLFSKEQNLKQSKHISVCPDQCSRQWDADVFCLDTHDPTQTIHWFPWKPHHYTYQASGQSSWFFFIRPEAVSFLIADVLLYHADCLKLSIRTSHIYSS